ncbi:MAG: RNA polymerase sigma factor [candidate division Zixibacteria bacterium]|nr:RNA polymerase sigma factor [candidate division Zixibacteria bacterium]
MDVQILLSKAKTGDKTAESDLFSFLHVRFSIVAQRRLGVQDAEDLVNDACITVLEKYRELPPETRFEPWAYRVLRNKIGSHLRDESVRKQAVETTGRIEEYEDSVVSSVDPEARMALIRCLRKLNRVYPRYARAVNLVNQGYSTGEICERLKLKRNNLYILLFRCRNWLNSCLANGTRADER